MKKIILLIASLASFPAAADTMHIEAQYYLPSGYSENLNCPNPSTVQWGSQCMPIPSGKSVRQCAGTISLKQAGVEALIWLVASNGYPLWVGHIMSNQNQPTPDIAFQTPQFPPDPSLLGNGFSAVWWQYSAVNNGVANPNTSPLEMQVICTAW